MTLQSQTLQSPTLQSQCFLVVEWSRLGTKTYRMTDLTSTQSIVEFYNYALGIVAYLQQEPPSYTQGWNDCRSSLFPKDSK